MLFGSPQPGILPSNGHVLVVSAKPDIGAVAIAEFQRLVLCDAERDGASDTRVRLFSDRVFYAVHACDSAEPEIAEGWHLRGRWLGMPKTTPR